MTDQDFGPKEAMDSILPKPSGRQLDRTNDEANRHIRRMALVVAAFGAALLPVVLAINAASPPPLRVAHGQLPRTASIAAIRDQGVGSRAIIPTTTSTTTTPTPPSTAPPAVSSAPPATIENTELLFPEDVPNPAEIRPIRVLGRIQIPKIGLDEELRDQITQQSIDLGPSHWPGTALPGGVGNAVIAGHRNSHSAPFRDVGNLVPGDTIVLVAEGRTFTYRVTELFVVNPDAVWITEQVAGRSLTLFTCHPLGESYQRLVVRATLV